MHLILFCVLCVLSVTTYGLRHGETKYGSLSFKPGEVDATRRQKRSLPNVIEKFLSKANLVNKVGFYRQYSRYGGHEQALKDFQMLEATDVTVTTSSKRGHIGEINVYMDTGVHEGREYTILSFMKSPKSPEFRNEITVYTIRYFE